MRRVKVNSSPKDFVLCRHFNRFLPVVHLLSRPSENALNRQSPYSHHTKDGNFGISRQIHTAAECSSNDCHRCTIQLPVQQQLSNFQSEYAHFSLKTIGCLGYFLTHKSRRASVIVHSRLGKRYDTDMVISHRRSKGN